MHICHIKFISEWLYRWKVSLVGHYNKCHLVLSLKKMCGRYEPIVRDAIGLGHNYWATSGYCSVYISLF